MSCLLVVAGCPHLLVVDVCFVLFCFVVFVVDCLNVLCFEIVKLYVAKPFTQAHGAVFCRPSVGLTAMLRHWRLTAQGELF